MSSDKTQHKVHCKGTASSRRRGSRRALLAPAAVTAATGVPAECALCCVSFHRPQSPLRTLQAEGGPR